MFRFNQICKTFLNETQYLGNCTDSFDSETGECYFSAFSDVSEFANREEEFREALEEGRDLFLTKEEFVQVIKKDYPFLKDSMEFYFYPESEYSPQVYVAYDPEEDIHYFFG